MNCPSIAGWLNIAAVTLNMAGVLILFWFRGEAIGAYGDRARDISRLRAYTADDTAGSGGSNDPRCSRGALVHHVAHRHLRNGHPPPLLVETLR